MYEHEATMAVVRALRDGEKQDNAIAIEGLRRTCLRMEIAMALALAILLALLCAAMFFFWA